MNIHPSQRRYGEQADEHRFIGRRRTQGTQRIFLSRRNAVKTETANHANHTKAVPSPPPLRRRDSAASRPGFLARGSGRGCPQDR
jgi:hypothetical protein